METVTSESAARISCRRWASAASELPSRLPAMVQSARPYAGFVGVFLLVVVSWESLTRSYIIDPTTLPPISQIMSASSALAGEGKLLPHVQSTLYRVLFSFFLAGISGVSLGLVVGWFRSVSQWVEPLVYVAYPVPRVAFLGVFFAFFGMGDGFKVGIAASSAFLTVIIATIVAVRNVNPVMIRAARDLGVNRVQLLKDIVLPASLPVIFAGLRLGLGICFIATIAMEMIVSPDRMGLGFLIESATLRREMAVAFVGAFSAALLGIASYFLFILVERRAMPWAQRPLG